MSIERLISTRTEVAVPDEAEVWDLASDEAGEAFEALSSETARRTLAQLYEEPRTASELADELDTSLQNVDYHVQNLLEAGLIEVATTRYSVTGNEMKVYAPTTNAVLLLSKESTAQRIRSRLARLFSTVLFVGLGALAFRSVLIGTVLDVPQVEVFAGPGDDAADGDEAGGADGGGTDGTDTSTTPDSADSPQETVTDDAQSTGDSADSPAGDAAADEDPDRYFTDDTADLDGTNESVTTTSPEPDPSTEPMGYVETINPLEHLPWLLDPGVTFLLGAVFALAVLVLLHRTVWRR